MIVMPSNNCKSVVHYWAGKYAGLLGHLYGLDGFRGPFPWLPYALDNGAFPAFTNGTPWSADAFRAHCDRAAGAPIQPLWVVVPDVVGDRAQEKAPPRFVVQAQAGTMHYPWNDYRPTANAGLNALVFLPAGFSLLSVVSRDLEPGARWVGVVALQYRLWSR